MRVHRNGSRVGALGLVCSMDAGMGTGPNNVIRKILFCFILKSSHNHTSIGQRTI